MSATLTAAPTAAARREGAGAHQLVSFRLDQEEYGVEITKVQEIILLGEITRLPQAPAFIRGLINLRSHVIPIADLRADRHPHLGAEEGPALESRAAAAEGHGDR